MIARLVSLTVLAPVAVMFRPFFVPNIREVLFVVDELRILEIRDNSDSLRVPFSLNREICVPVLPAIYTHGVAIAGKETSHCVPEWLKKHPIPLECLRWRFSNKLNIAHKICRACFRVFPRSSR